MKVSGKSMLAVQLDDVISITTDLHLGGGVLWCNC